MISLDPLAPGSVYILRWTTPRSASTVLEVGCSTGTGKLKIAGGVEMGQKVKMGVAWQVDTTNFHVEAIDLLSNHVPCEAGIASVAAPSTPAIKGAVQAGLVILGDLSIQGEHQTDAVLG